MAKGDRDKQAAALFRGVDDKSITFQRAVFIVCNLKRLIKRPKKDDKYCTGGSSSGSRKRSAGADNDGSERSQLDSACGQEGADMGPNGIAGHYAGAKLRFRNPIRRAFTLPTILCGSFVGLGGESESSQVEAGSNSMGRSDEDYQEDDDNDNGDYEDYDYSAADNHHGSQEFAERASPVTTRNSVHHSDFYSLGDDQTKRRPRRVVINDQTPDQAGVGSIVRRPTGRRARRGPRKSSGSSSSSAAVVTQANRFVGPANNYLTDCDRIGRANESSAPLSCLVTPIRRITAVGTGSAQTLSGGNSTTTSDQPQRRARSSQRSAQQPIVYNRQPARLLVDCHGYNLSSTGGGGAGGSNQPPLTLRDFHLAAANDDSAKGLVANRQAKTASGDQALCCPIWLLAMELLDASQAQPRDQSRHDHLLGPPSSLSYLLAPTNPDLDRSGPVELHTSDSGSAVGTARRADSSADDSSDGASLRHSGGDDGQSSDNDEDDEYGPSTGEQISRMKMKRFSSSALCLNDTDRMAAHNKTGGATNESKRASRAAVPGAKRTNEGPQLQATDKESRGDQQGEGANQLSANARSARATDCSPPRIVLANSSPRGRASQNQPTITVNSLAPTGPEDPIVLLARQRRPSVSNQGSLNVDQQALFSAVECNQLERVRSILDDGKVNVNSLNGDKLTCLDVAVLLRNPAMVRLLQHYKAKESSAYLTSEGRENQLYSLYMEAKRLVEDLSRSIGAMASPNSPTAQGNSEPAANSPADQQLEQPQQQLMLATGSLLSSALFEEKQRQLQYWRRRLDLFMQMRYGFEKLDVPSVPELVVLQVVGENSLGLKIVHSLGQINELFSSLTQRQHQLQEQQQQQQRQKKDTQADSLGAANSMSSLNESIAAPLARPMSRLIALAQQRRLYCPLGPRCTHWLMDEIVAYKQNSDQFQSYDPDDFLAQHDDATAGHQVLPAEVRKQPVRPRADQSAAAAARANALAGAKSRQQQEKLAIFNQLLAQQLIILNNQQRNQQQQRDLIQGGRHKSPNPTSVAAEQHETTSSTQQPRPSNQHLQQQLIYAHQIESTDSAYASIAAAAANTQQQQQQQASLLAIQPASLLQFDAPASLAASIQQQPPIYRSLAYQLMTARRYNDALAVQASNPVRMGDKLAAAGSVRLANTGRQRDPSDLMAASISAREHGGVALRTTLTPMITKYKVEWSNSSSFEPVHGSMIIYNTNSYPLECQIGALENGQSYYVRVSSGNHRGFSHARLATPACLAPSSWRQVQTATTGARSTTAAAITANSNAISATRKKFKYDEEVFRKFTKLILLNKHILDENQLNWLQREQQQLQQSEGGLSGAKSKWVANKMADLQNKSSLINMLLLDATMPTSTGSRTAEGRTSGSGGKWELNVTGGPLTGDSMGHQFRMTAASSPRGSLYPIGGSTSSVGPNASGNTDDNDSLSGQSNDAQTQQQQQPQTSLRVRKNLRHLFQSNSTKFNKLNNQNKRGLYLVTVIYHATNGAGSNGHPKSSKGRQSEQPIQAPNGASNLKLVVTNDDRLPVIEVFNDLVAPSSLMADFCWLLKINGTSWIDMKRLRQQLQRSHSSSTLHLRIKLLAAIEQMQLALNLEDIGRLFYKPIQDHDGSIVICTCRSVSNTKQVSNLSTKWTSQHKLIPRHLKKIADLIAASNRDREWQQEQQMRQQQLTRNSLASLPSHRHQQQSLTTVPLNKRHSSSAMSTNSAHMNSAKQPTGSSSDNLQAAGWTMSSVLNPIVSPCSTPPSNQEFASTASSLSSSNTTAINSTGLNTPSSVELDQQSNARPLSTASQSQLPAEVNRLCEACQQALVQRRCTMASGSSSSSLASNESQSWSSSQFSLCSQQQQQQQPPQLPQTAQTIPNSCTCSRSNSSVAASLALGSTHYQPPQQHQGKLSTTNNQLTATSYLSSQQASLPASQRNSTQSNRSASGSVGMMMMMIGQNQPSSGSSFSSAQIVPSSAGGSLSGPSNVAGGRSSQPQQLSTDTQGVNHQASSTYLMLASLSLYDLLLFHLKEIIEFDQTSTTPLKRGLYLGFVQLQTTVESMRLLVPRRRPNMLPCARIRDNAHVSREEWALLKRFAAVSSSHHSAGRPSSISISSKLSSSPGEASRGQCYAANTTATESKISSLGSDPLIWSPQSSGKPPPVSPRQEPVSIKSDLRPPNVQKTQLGTNDSPGFDRNRAKSVSPGLINSGKPCKGSPADKMTIAEAQALARSTKKRLTELEPLLKPVVNSSSCNIDDKQTDGVGDGAHARSDTDLALANAGAPTQEGGEPLVGVEHSSSDSNLLTDCAAHHGGQATQSPVVAHASPISKQRSGSSGSIAALRQSPEMTFVRLIGDAARRLLLELKSQLPKVFDEARQELVSILASLNDEENNRVYHIELIELSNQVTFILLIPAPENVCPVTSNERSNILAHNQDYMLLPLQIFETIHLSTYEPDLLGKYSRLSTILETDLIVAQHDHRQAFSTNELKSTKARVSHLQDMVSIADEFWRQLRWIVDVVSFARDKSQLNTAPDQALATSGSIRLGTIWRYFEELASNPNSCLGGALLASSGLFSRKSAELLAVGGSQQDLVSATSAEQRAPSSVVACEHSKVALMKTNSSGTALTTTESTTCMDDEYGPARKADLGSAEARNEIKRTSSAQFQQKQRLRSHQEPPARRKIPPASPANYQRPRLPEIQLPSSDTNDGLQNVGPERGNDDRLPGSVSSNGRSRTGRRHHSHPHDDESSSTKTRRDHRRHAELESQTGVRADEDTANKRADNDVQCGDGDERNESSCFEESILKVEFGDPNREVVLVSHNETGGNIEAETEVHDIDDDDEAIYAYHISLRDATKAAAKRKSSQQLINLFIDPGESPSVESSAETRAVRQVGGGSITNREELESTCGGLNLDRRQFERFAPSVVARLNNDNIGSAVAQMSAVQEETDEHRQIAQGDFCFGDVIAYKFKKVSKTAASSHTSITTMDCNEAANSDLGGSSGPNEDPTRASTGNNAPLEAGEATNRPCQFKSKNPFLTDSFEL